MFSVFKTTKMLSGKKKKPRDMLSGFRTGSISHILFPRDAADKCMEARNAYAEARKQRVEEFVYSGYTGHYDNSGYRGGGAMRLHCLAAEQATRS